MRQRQQRRLGAWGWLRCRLGFTSDHKLLLSMSWPPLPTSVREVRGALAAACPGNETLLLLGSELATNAVEHARSWFRVELRTTTDGVRLTVFDHVPTAVPSPSGAGAIHDPLAERGRGLLLVNNLARDWGVAMFHDGKAVWLDLPDREGTLLAQPLLV